MARGWLKAFDEMERLRGDNTYIYKCGGSNQDVTTN